MGLNSNLASLAQMAQMRRQRKSAEHDAALARELAAAQLALLTANVRAQAAEDGETFVPPTRPAGTPQAWWDAQQSLFAAMATGTRFRLANGAVVGLISGGSS